MKTTFTRAPLKKAATRKAKATPLYADTSKVLTEEDTETDYDIGRIVHVNAPKATPPVHEYYNMTKEELIDEIEFYREAAYTNQQRTDWLKRRLETVNDIPDDDDIVYSIKQNLKKRFEGMLARGSKGQVGDTLSGLYSGKEAEPICRHYPRLWNALREVLLDFYQEHDMLPSEDWHRAGDVAATKDDRSAQRRLPPGYTGVAVPDCLNCLIRENTLFWEAKHDLLKQQGEPVPEGGQRASSLLRN